ncbi:MAG: hypothetical protein ACP5NW_01855, partial [Candidatus Woesearchaeota archaeon]
GNETPLVSFNRNEPLFASIVSNTVHDICESLYAAIGPKGNDNYRIAAAVMLMTGKKKFDYAIINRA